MAITIQGGQTVFTPTLGGGGMIVASVTGSGAPKMDTRLYVDHAASGTNDESQYDTDLTVFGGDGDGDGGYEATSTRLEIAAPRSIRVVFDADNNDSGTLVALCNSGATRGKYRARVDGSGNVDFYYDNGTTLAVFHTMALPSVSGTTELYYLQWSTTQDFLQSYAGATDTHRHEFTIYNSDQDTWSIEQAVTTTTDETDAGTYDFGYQGYHTGSGTPGDFYTPDIDYVEVCARFRSSAEFREDWVAQSTPSATGDLDLREPHAPVPSTIVSSDGDGTFAGAHYAQAGKMAYECGQRTLSPLVNEIFASPGTYLNTYSPAARFSAITLNGTSYTFPLGLTWHRPAPSMANRLRVSIHMVVWDNAASASKTVSVALVSSSERPGIAGFIGSPVERYYTETSRTADDTATGAGAYLTISQDVRIARDDDGWTWCSVGFNATDSGARWAVYAVSFDPVPYATGGTLPLEVGP